MTISADFTVNAVANPGAHVVTYGSTINLAMLSTVGASVIQWSVVAASHTDISLPTITSAGSPIGSTASFTFPADPGDGQGRAVRVKLRVSNERESAEQYAIVGVPSPSGIIPFCIGEDFDRNATFGWTQDLNKSLAGGGTSLGIVYVISKGSILP